MYVFLRTVDARAMMHALDTANLLFALPAVGVYFVGVWLRAVRWQLLVAPFADVGTGRLFRVIVIGFAINNVLPFRLGELARTFLLRHSNGIPIAATLASILLERVLDVVALSALLVVVSVAVPLDGWLAGLASLSWIVAGGAGIGLLVLLVAPRRRLRQLMDLAVTATDRKSGRLARLVESFLNGTRAIETPGAMVTVGLLSIACWVAELGLYVLLMIGFGFDSGVFSLVAGMVAANLATAVPSSPGYIGTFDVPLQSVLVDSFGVTAAVASSYTLVAHASLLVPVTLVGLLLLSREDLSIRALGRGRLELRSAERQNAPS